MGNGKMSSISVVVPVYNAEKYLKRCIDSILIQTFQDFELILVDDGSPDDSGKICDTYAEKDRRVRVIHQTNQGQAAARNQGIAEAQGEWIAFVDADDAIHPQMLELLYRAAKDNEVKISVCKIYEGETFPRSFAEEQKSSSGACVVDEDALLHFYNYSGASYISRYTYWVVWGKLIHRSLLEKLPFTEGRIYEDNALVFRWLYEAGRIAFCDNCMYFYFVNSNGTTKSSYSLRKLDWIWALEEQIRFYKQVRFARMETAVCTRYVKEAVGEYENICCLLRNRKAAKGLRRKITVFWAKNRTKVMIPRNEKMDLLTRLYPKEVRFLWRIKNMLTYGRVKKGDKRKR